MKKEGMASGAKAKHFLDISREICPMTFVRAKLMLEQMAPGETIEILLKGEEPLANLPRSAEELGHEVLTLEAEPGQGPTGLHRLVIRKT